MMTVRIILLNMELMIFIDDRRRRSLPNQDSKSNINALVHRGSVVGVYVGDGIISRPMPVIGTTTDTVANIGLCQTEQMEAATMINCSMGANKPQKMLHVQAVIG